MQEFLYETTQGDTWDLISFKVFGTERFSKKIAQNNLTYIKTVIFPPGVKILIPNEIKVEEKGEKPAWL